jgi:xylulose-5-phosphate/fructose-6-phosphate phosphoketolase
MSEARAPDASAPAGASGPSDVEVWAAPFDVVVRNDLDCYRPAVDVIDRVPGLGVRAVAVRQAMADIRTRHHAWIREHGTDLPDVADWARDG